MDDQPTPPAPDLTRGQLLRLLARTSNADLHWLRMEAIPSEFRHRANIKITRPAQPAADPKEG